MAKYALPLGTKELDARNSVDFQWDKRNRNRPYYRALCNDREKYRRDERNSMDFQGNKEWTVMSTERGSL